MALDFPASPSNGQIFSSGGVSWTFDGEKWKISSSSIEPVFISSSTPTGVAGQIYWDSDESTAYIYYDDGNTAQWVPLVSTAPVSFDTSAIVSGTLPVARGGTGTTSFDAGKISEGNTEAEVVDTGSDGHFKVTIEGTELFKIDSSGNVGIGTNSPGSLLTVEASTGDATATIHAAQNDSGADAQLEIETSNDFAESAVAFKDSTGLAGGVRYNHGDNAIRFLGEGNNAEMARFDSSGRLLIGTSTAGAFTNRRVSIATSSGTTALELRSATDGDSRIIFTDSTDSSDSGSYKGQILYNQTSDYMSFNTNGNNERMRIDNIGRTIVHGTTSNGTLIAETSQGAASNKNIIVGGHSATTLDSGTACFVVLSNGNVVNTNNSYGALSDVKLKENIVDASSQWDDIKAVQVRNYNLKESTGQQTHTQLGVIAQEIEAVSPGLVSDSPDLDADGNDLGTVTKSVNYSVLYMKAVKALQEAMDRIETLETKVAALEAE